VTPGDVAALTAALGLALGLPILGLVGRTRLAAVTQEPRKAERPARAPVRRPVLAPPPAAPAPSGLPWTSSGLNQWDSGPYRVKLQMGSWVMYGRADKVLVPVGRFASLAEAKAKAQEIANQEPV
jgi:hypothetical protein